MKTNLGLTDRIIRILFAVVVAILFFTNQISGVAAIILGLLAIILLVTGLVSFCPIYAALKLSTAKKSES